MPSIRHLSVAALLLLAACSSDESATVDEPATGTLEESAPSTTEVVDEEPGAAALAESDATLADAATEWTVTIDVAVSGVDGDEIDTSVSWTGDPDSIVDGGPFGHFGACSGLRSAVGAYSVMVSGDDGLDAVSVWTADRVAAAGIYDAEVRIERVGESPLTASGTLTVLDGLQSGEFVAFAPSGGRVDGSFACEGTVPPTPLPADPDVTDGALDAVEVFALLRDGESERVLGLAADSSSAAECPSVDGRSSDVVVRVAGDAALGGLTSFELVGEPGVTGRLTAGGETFELDGVGLTLDDGGSSGVFSGTTSRGVTVDGAFRCS